MNNDPAQTNDLYSDVDNSQQTSVPQSQQQPPAPQTQPVPSAPSTQEGPGIQTVKPEYEPVSEIYTPPEVLEPTPSAPTQPEQTANKTPQPPQSPQTEVKNIVDLRTGHEVLEGVGSDADKLTVKADEEEEKFIKEVEEHHGPG